MVTKLNTDTFNLGNIVSERRLVGLWRLTAGYRLLYLLAIVSVAIASLAKTSTSLLLKYFVDNYLPAGADISTLPFIAFGFVGLAVLEGGASFLSGRSTSKTAESITRRLRNYLFDHIQHLSYTYHNNAQTGDLIQRCTSDVDATRQFFSEQAIGMSRVMIVFIVNFTALLNLNVKLALISIVVVPAIVLVSAFFFRKITKAYEAYQQQDGVLSTTLQENLSGVRVVKAFARQEYETNKFDKDNFEKYTRGQKLLTLHSLFWPVSDSLCGFQILAGYIVGALMVLSGEISIGTYLAYAGLVIYLTFPMRNLGRLIVQTSTGLVSFGRLLTILREKREPLDEGDVTPAGTLQGEVTFENVGFEYNEGNIALQNITFQCKPGQVVALLGSTGSGKTTLVNLLPRFFEYTSGRILLDGIDLKRYPRRYLRQQIGIVEQEPFLFSRSIRENITYGVKDQVTEEQVEEAARAAAIHESILTFHDGYRTMLGEKGVTLSGGQKQRVAIARTLLKNPRLLILDDSTSSVDTETEAEIREALVNLMKNRTTFIIAHRIQSIMDADLILVMDKGRIIQCGKHEELIDQEGPYRKIYDIQTQIEDNLRKEIESV